MKIKLKREPKKMELHLYKTYAITDYNQDGNNGLEFDYSSEFDRIAKIRGYVHIQYYVTDTPDFKPDEVFYSATSGDIHKVIEKVCTFTGESPILNFISE